MNQAKRFKSYQKQNRCQISLRKVANAQSYGLDDTHEHGQGSENYVSISCIHEVGDTIIKREAHLSLESAVPLQNNSRFTDFRHGESEAELQRIVGRTYQTEPSNEKAAASDTGQTILSHKEYEQLKVSPIKRFDLKASELLVGRHPSQAYPASARQIQTVKVSNFNAKATAAANQMQTQVDHLQSLTQDDRARQPQLIDDTEVATLDLRHPTRYSIIEDQINMENYVSHYQSDRPGPDKNRPNFFQHVPAEGHSSLKGVGATKATTIMASKNLVAVATQP